MKIFNLIIISFLIFNGCAVEHQLSINLDSEKINIDYIQSRDFNDLPFFVPENIDQWETIETTDLNVYYKRTFGYDESVNSLFTLDSIPENETINQSIENPNINNELILKEPIKISHHNYFIFSNYNVKLIFKNRKVRAHYDKLFNYYSGFYEDVTSNTGKKKNASNTKENYNEIVNQLIGFFFLEMINRADIGFNEKGIYLNSLKNWKNTLDISPKLDDNLAGLKVDKLLSILSSAEQYLYSVVDEKHAPEIKMLWKELQFDILITHLLLFNDFMIKSNLPGELIDHNADSTSYNNLFWNVNINDIENNDVILYAKSRIVHKRNILILCIVLLILGFATLKNRFKSHPSS